MSIDDTFTEKELVRRGFKKVVIEGQIEIMRKNGHLYALTAHYDSGVGKYYKILFTNDEHYGERKK